MLASDGKLRLPPPLLVLPALLLALNPASAWSSTFDEDTGRLDVSDAAFSISFDSLDEMPLGHDFMITDTDYNILNATQAAALFVEDGEGLEGDGALHFGGESIYTTLGLGPLAESLRGRRVAINIWQRPEGTRATIDVYWYANSGSRADPFLGDAPLRPTGRVTDDGWEEWSTGPIDFAAGGEYGPTVLTAYDSQLTLFQTAYFASYNYDARVRLDALEIVDLGPALVEPNSCTILNETEQCGDEGLCLFGRCVDAALVAGTLPSATANIRDDYIDRRIHDYSTSEGGRRPQAAMADLVAAFESMRTAPTSRFWPTMQDAIERLQDGHASAPYATYPASAAVGTCVHLGVADLVSGEPELPLVFSTDGRDPLSRQLEEGDVLLEIDGLTPEEWTVAAERLISFGGDQDARALNTAPDLAAAAIISGSTLTFARCEREGPAPTPCTDDELELITFDMADLVSEPLWTGSPPGWLTDEPLSCDFRFRRDIDGDEVLAYEYAGWVDIDGARTLIINGVPSYWAEGGEDWFDAVGSAIVPSPEALILDQRLGGGGSIEATDYLTSMLIAEDDFYAMELYPNYERDFDESLRADLESCMNRGEQDCGGAWRWVLGESSSIPAIRGASADTPLAILNSLDVSGNDFTTMLLSQRSGPTRIFGPGPTWGAFGPISGLPAHLGELSGGSLQWLDTLFLVESGDREAEFTTGQGVEPDVRVLQRQSDAIQGIDTIVTAARAWLAEEGS